jgi:hypothetical protein
VRAYHALALVPPLALLAGLRFANRVEPYVFGLPFLLFWIVAWVVATSATMWLIWVLDRRRAIMSSKRVEKRDAK